jgi:hypothetical protein
MQVIRGIAYRHIAGYLKVVGITRQAAEESTRHIGTVLKGLLPEGTIVKSGRYRGVNEEMHVFEVPVILNRPGVRKILAGFVLRGGLEEFFS